MKFRDWLMLAAVLLVYAICIHAASQKDAMLRVVGPYPKDPSVLMVEPMRVPQLGVTVESGAPLKPHDVLSCTAKQRIMDAEKHVSAMVLVCGERTLVIRGIEF